MTYLDTSALIKRFVAEPGSPRVQQIIRREPVATATIAYAEAFAGLNRKQREGHLSKARYAVISRQFETDWQAYIRVELHEEVLRLARTLCERHPLRGLDAIHLASALSLKTMLGEAVTFAAADARLLCAAEAEDLQPLDVEAAPAT